MGKGTTNEIQVHIKDEGSASPTKSNSTSNEMEIEEKGERQDNKSIDQKCVDYLRHLCTKCIKSKGLNRNQNDKEIEIESQDKSIDQKCVRYLRHLCIKCINSKGLKRNQNDKETEAYKRLMDHFERDLLKQFPKKLWLVRVFVLGLLVCLLTTACAIPVIREHLLLHLKLFNWAFLLLVVISGLPLVRVATFILSEPLIWVFRMGRHIVFFGRLLKTKVDITIWLTIVLWVWYTWYRPQVVKDTLGARTMHASIEEYKHVLKIVVKEITRLLLALNIGALLWTIKKLIFLKLLADLHFMALCDHIKNTFFDFTTLRYIENRNALLLKDQPHTQNKREKNGKPGQDDLASEDKGAAKWWNVLELNKERVPIWILKHMIDTYMSYYDSQNGKIKVPKILVQLQDIEDNEKLMKEAKEMLGRIIDGDKRDIDITQKILSDYGMKDEEIKQVFMWWTKDENTQSITQDQFLRWVVKAVKRCKGLKRTIESSRRVFRRLELLMNLFVVVVSIVIWLLLSELVNTGQIAILFTPFVSASFIFGTSLSRAFDGLMFVFGLHPFDVGDRVIIDNEEMQVIELNILKTVFIKSNTGKTAIYPNFQLCTMFIINLEVEPEDFDFVDFTVPLNTPQERRCDLQIKIKKTLDDEVAFSSDTVVAEKAINDSTVTMTVFFKHLVTYRSSEMKAQQRSKVLCDISKLCKEMEMERDMIDTKMMKYKDSMPAHTLKFEFEPKLKLEKIEGIKKKITRAVERYPNIKEPFCQALFTSIDKDKITMDVRLWCLADPIKTKEDKTKFIDSIQDAIDKEEEKQPEDGDLHQVVFGKKLK